MMTATRTGGTVARRASGPATVVGPRQQEEVQMTDQVSPRYSSPAREREVSGWAVGFILFAGIMMITVGVFQVLAGLVAIVNDAFYVSAREYLYQFNVSTWGWIHLIVGAVVALAGWGVLTGRTWGRVVGIILAVLSAITNFLFLPYYPFWTLLMIALNVFVIWALAAHGREVTT
jgi:hypothetical protein